MSEVRMGSKDDKDILNSIDDDFDYEQEIKEIEAQEKELEALRAKKKAELEKHKAQMEASSKNENAAPAKSRREIRERRKEAAWLGEAFDEETDSVEPKKKSKKGIIALVILLIALIGAGGAYACNYHCSYNGNTQKNWNNIAYQSCGVDSFNAFVFHNDYLQK